MEKESIVAIAKEFLNKTTYDVFLEELQENYKKFLTTLSKLNDKQISRILNIHPEYANKTIGGWHSLHYACLKNDPFILDIFLDKAIKNGLSSLPNTTKEKAEIAANTSLLCFCAANNCDKSYAKLLTVLTNPETQDFSEHLLYAISYYQPKVASFLKNIIDNEIFQKTAFNFLKRDDRFNIHLTRVLKYGVSSNIQRLENFGVDLTYNKEDKNYLTLYLEQAITEYYWFGEDDTNEKKDDKIKKFKKNILFFLDKGFSLEIPDNSGTIPQEQLVRFVDSLSGYEVHWELSKFITDKDLAAKSLSNQLIKHKRIEPKKVKI